jgi:hypothetical protein
MYPCSHFSQFQKVFWIVFGADLALDMGKNGRAALDIRAQGKMLLGFSATHDPDSLVVFVDDISLSLIPLEVSFPGESNVIRIPTTQLGPETFDLGDCHGVHNIKTGELKLQLALTLRPERFPQLLQIGVATPVRVTTQERGHLNLEHSTIEFRAESFHVSQGLMGALTVHPGRYDEKPALDFKNCGNHCDAQIEAAGLVGANQPPASIMRDPQRRLTICPGYGAYAQYHNTLTSRATVAAWHPRPRHGDQEPRGKHGL